MKLLHNLLSNSLILLVKFYKLSISPFLGNNCRYTPTCSTYMIQAIQKHGAFKGVVLGLKRFSRCRPSGGHGWDPVP